MLAMLLVPSVGVLGLGALLAVLVLMGLVGDVFSVVLPAGFVVVAVLFVVRTVQRMVCRHDQVANSRLKPSIRTEHPQSCRTTVEARILPPPALAAVVRLPIPADTGGDAPVTPVSVGATRERHAR